MNIGVYCVVFWRQAAAQRSIQRSEGSEAGIYWAQTSGESEGRMDYMLSVGTCLQSSLGFCSPAARLRMPLILALGKMPFRFRDSPSGWVACVGVGTWTADGEKGKINHTRIPPHSGKSTKSILWLQLWMLLKGNERFFLLVELQKLHRLMYHFRRVSHWTDGIESNDCEAVSSQ